MTITPETMQAEMRLVRPTLVVLTNVRDDHRETLGSDPAAQRAAYLEAILRGRSPGAEDASPASTRVSRRTCWRLAENGPGGTGLEHAGRREGHAGRGGEVWSGHRPS